MITQRLDLMPPRLKEAYQLSAVLIFTIVAILAPLNVLSGQIQNFGEFMPMVTGYFTAVFLSGIPYFALRLAAGRLLLLAVPIMIAGVTGAAILMTAVDIGWFYILHPFFPQARMPVLDLAEQTIIASFYWIQYACLTALLLVSGAARKIRVRETELARSQMATLQARLNMLRMQLNPHFMCNSLNVISSLIVAGRHSDAQRMADKLAEFLRASSAVEGLETELSDELDMIDAYLEVEAARFGERLHVEVQHNEAVEHALVPNFILQPLVENALKYGVQASRGPAEVRVLSHRDRNTLVLSVENEAREAEKDMASPGSGGVGLDNIRSRLTLLFGSDAMLTTESLPNGYRATIRLPFRAASSAKSEAGEPAIPALQ